MVEASWETSLNEVRDACWQATHDISVLKTLVDSAIAKYKSKSGNEIDAVVEHGFGQAMTDAWRTMEDMHELIVVHPGSTESVKWYDPRTWLSYGLENGKFNRIVSSIDTANLRNAVERINAAREGIEDSINYFADFAQSPDFERTRDFLRKHRGGEIHGAADPAVALDALPMREELFPVHDAYTAAFAISVAAEPVKKYISALRRRRGD